MRFPTKFPVCRSVLAGWILLALPAAAHAALPVPVNSYASQDSGNDWVSRRPSASDGQGHWVTVWIDGDQRRILASTSADNGTSWSEAVVVHDTGSNQNLGMTEIATDRNGVWIVVWNEHRSAESETGSDFDIFCSRSTDNGQTWSEPVRLNRDTTFNETPVVAFDGQGRPMVVWSGKGGPEGREESRGEPRMGSSCFSVSGFEGTHRLESLRHFSRPPFCCSIALHRRKRSGLEFAEPGGMLEHAGTPAVRVADP